MGAAVAANPGTGVYVSLLFHENGRRGQVRRATEQARRATGDQSLQEARPLERWMWEKNSWSRDIDDLELDSGC
jgi:hypothetical protein